MADKTLFGSLAINCNGIELNPLTDDFSYLSEFYRLKKAISTVYYAVTFLCIEADVKYSIFALYGILRLVSVALCVG